MATLFIMRRVDSVEHAKYLQPAIAMFSRCYLEDYPIHVLKRSDGLLVIGLPQRSAVNYYFSITVRYIQPVMIGVVAFITNVLLMIY